MTKTERNWTLLLEVGHAAGRLRSQFTFAQWCEIDEMLAGLQDGATGWTAFFSPWTGVCRSSPVAKERMYRALWALLGRWHFHISDASLARLHESRRLDELAALAACDELELLESGPDLIDGLEW